MTRYFERRYGVYGSPKISVVISTRNRCESLARCLDAIAKMDAPVEWELVIVDNGSSDDTPAVVERFATTFQKHLIYVFQPIKGLSNARNAGCAVATGEILAFTDDDCYVDDDYLVALLHMFENHQVGYGTGRIMLYDSSDFRVTINESTQHKEFLPGKYIAPGEIKGANMAFRRSVLVQISGFDPLFGSGALFPSEDCDAAARASLSGSKGVYDPRLCVFHHHGRKAGNLETLYKDYDVGRGAYHAKLLVHCRKPAHFLQGIRGLPRRIMERPSSLYWELNGAVNYLLQAKKQRPQT